MRPTRHASPTGSTPWLCLVPALLAAGCADSGTTSIPNGGGGGGNGGGPSPALNSCTIPTSEIFAATAKDGIPALTDPLMVVQAIKQPPTSFPRTA